MGNISQLELLQGCRNEQEWTLLQSYLQVQDYVELVAGSWQSAARIYYDLRRQGLTVRSSIDCCIAQLEFRLNARLKLYAANLFLLKRHR